MRRETQSITMNGNGGSGTNLNRMVDPSPPKRTSLRLAPGFNPAHAILEGGAALIEMEEAI